MVKLGKINISPRNYSSLSKVLFVPLVVLHEIEHNSVKPCLRLRRLNRVLALCPRGSKLSSRSHMEDEARARKEVVAGREKKTHT